MQLRRAFPFSILAVFFWFASLVSAQSPTTGQIAGVAKDATGAVVAGARITLTSSAGVERTTTSDATGHYAFSLLPPGTYRVEAEKAGFSKATAAGVVAQITQTTGLDLPLTVASQKAVVEVAAETPLLDTESPAQGTVINEEQIRQLPLPTRNFQQLLTLTPGTSGPVQNSAELGRGAAPIYVDGMRSTSNSVIINGTDANSIGTGSTPNLAVPATDSLQEFIVQTSQYDASQGRVAGGVVAAVTKSGTDTFHGNAYEFLRNTELNANNYFLNRSGVPRPQYQRNQFGGTLGGPLVKDRVFFFVSYQGSRERNGTSLLNSVGTVVVPSILTNDRSEQTLDNLAQAYGVAFCATSPNLGCLQANNQMADFLLKAALPNGQSVIPSAPSNCTPVNGFCNAPVVGISKFREDQLNGNLDFQLSNKNRLSAKFFGANNPATQALFNLFGLANALPVPGFGGTANLNQRVLAVDDTYLVTQQIVNNLHFGFGFITTGSQPQEPFTAAQLGISSPLGNLFAGMPEISVANEFDLGASPFADNSGVEKTYSANDTLSWQKGRHSLKFGGEYKHHELNETFNLYTRGQMFFLGFSGNPFTDFLGGFFDTAGLTIMGSGVNNRDVVAHDANGFVNDDWRVTNRLTLTLGVRYDYFSPFTESKGRFVGFDPDRLTTVQVPGLGAVVTGGFVQAANATNPLPGVPLVQSSLVSPDKNNFAPRIGFSWQPRSDNRLVMRGGYGVYYDRANSRLLNNQILDFPYYTLAQAFLTPISTPFVQVPLPNQFPLLFNNASVFPFGGPPAFLPRAASIPFPATVQDVSANGIYPDLHDFRTPYIQQYGLGIENEFANNWMLNLSYVGSAGRKLYRLADLNQAVAQTALGPAGVYSPGLSALAVQGFGLHVMQSSSNSSYNSLQASIKKRLSFGLQFLASYTWSHSLDDYSGDPTGTSDVTVVPGNQAPGMMNNYAGSDFDRRHRFVFSGVYDLPTFYKGRTGFAKQAVNGWELSSVIQLQSGTPFSVLTNDTAFVQARANYVPGCNPAEGGSVRSRLDMYFNTACFAPATADATGGFGNTGRNILRGPNQKNVDISVVKFFPVTGRTRVEFRSEFFNAFNNVSFQNPDNVIASPSFGQILEPSTGPRVIQFALKVNF
jgi:carboxypeptidase family protein/TonB-dependent receptor-like protein